MRLVVPQRAADNNDYRRFDMPTVMRRQTTAQEEAEPTATAEVAASREDPDYLDIPAFLRRQAD